MKEKLKEKINDLKGQLEIMNTYQIKPNFSELERVIGLNRHTIKKYYEGYEGKSMARKKSSKLDKYRDRIESKLKIIGTNQMAVYQYFYEMDNDIGTYSNFKKYLKKHNLRPNKTKKVHLRYETDPGEQLQFDWKEDLQMISKHGEIFEFNVFSATLGYSRLHNYVYSKTKCRNDLERCLMETFKYINGVPKRLLTDNMRTVVDIDQNNNRKVNSSFKQFLKDMGTEIKLCRPSTPETKGKVETCNKFMTWLTPYNHEFEDEEELIKIIKKIRDKANKQINQTTNCPPLLLYQKEKEYLLPLPKANVMLSYLDGLEKTKVQVDSLIYYKGKRYSVNPKYIGQYVQAKQIEDIIYIYHEKQLIATYKVSNKAINYNKEDYKAGLKTVMPYKTEEEIEKYTNENLKRFDKLLVKNKEMEEK